MTLPAGAQDVELETIDLPPYRAVHRLTMHLPLDDTRRWCEADRLGGPWVAVLVPRRQRPFLKTSSTPPEGSIICSSSWPQDVSWQRVLLATPSEDDGLASVTVAVYRMPEH